MNTWFSLRARLIGLVVLAMMLLLGIVVLAGTHLFVSDKEAYVMDYSLTQSRSAASSLDSQIQRVLLLAQPFMRKTPNQDELQEVFESNKNTLRIKNLLVFDIHETSGLYNPRSTQMKLRHTFGDTPEPPLRILDQMGWDSVRLTNDLVSVGRTRSNELAISRLVKTQQGIRQVYIFFVNPDLNPQETLGQFQLYLLDGAGAPFELKLSAPGLSDATGFQPSEIIDISKTILSDKTSSGAKALSTPRGRYLASYFQSQFKDLMVISLAPEKVLFSAVYGFSSRMTILGISIILITVGLMLLWLKKLTQTMRSMTEVLQRASAGNYNVRIDTYGLREDELGTFSTTFNLLMENLDHLISEIEAKLVTHYELQVSEGVQTRFFPTHAFQCPQLSFAASSLLSPQFGGDWWHYEKVGPWLVTVIGKVEGKGVHAALVTAAITGTLKALVSDWNPNTQKESVNLKALVEKINSVIFQAGKGNDKFPCAISLIETESGFVQMMCAGHLPPTLHRIEFENVPIDMSKRFSYLPARKNSALGSAANIHPEIYRFQLEPGDVLIWHTEGLLKTLNSKGEVMSTQKLFPDLVELIDQPDVDAAKLSSVVVQRLKLFYGEVCLLQPEDITIATLVVPKKIMFKLKEVLSA